MSLTIVSLFSGVGGIDLAGERVGMATRLLCEIDKYARTVLAHHFPHAHLHHDITELTADDLRASGAVPDRTVLCAGFPCQDLSVAGGRKGMGEGTRSGLYWHIVRLLAGFRSRWVVLENVPGLLSSHGGRDMGAVLGSLADLGYGYAWRVLDAQHFGVPQRRRRVVIVGHLGAPWAAPAEVLLEPEGGSRDSAARIPARPVPAADAARGIVEVVGTLQARHPRNDADSVASGHFIVQPHTLAEIAADHGVTASTCYKVMLCGGYGFDGHPLAPKVKTVREPSESIDWMQQAACVGVDPEAFFTDRQRGQRVDPMVREICDGCPVKAECLDYATRHGEIGVWGGTTERERGRRVA